MTAEGTLVKGVLQYLKFKGVFAWRNNTGMLRNTHGKPVFYGKVGSGDILGVLSGGRFLAIECKAGTRKPTIEQVGFMWAINDQGGLAFVARSIQDVEVQLEKLTQEGQQ